MEKSKVIKIAVTNTQKHLYQSTIATIMLRNNNSKIQCLQEYLFSHSFRLI